MLFAQIAQLVEQRIENPRVGGSIPPLGTIILEALQVIAGLFRLGTTREAYRYR